MGRRAGYYIDPIAFLERQVRRDTDMDSEVREYGLGLLSWWAEWADGHRLELPEREIISDVVRAHLGGASMKPDSATRARILGSVDRAVRGIRQRLPGGAKANGGSLVKPAGSMRRPETGDVPDDEVTQDEAGEPAETADEAEDGGTDE